MSTNHKTTAFIIIPFSYESHSIKATERAIEGFGGWERSYCTATDLYRHVCMMFSPKNDNRIAACYSITAAKLMERALPGCTNCCGAGTKKCTDDDALQNDRFSFCDSSLWVFDTGIGFLCLQCECQNASTVRYLKSINGGNCRMVSRKKSGGGIAEFAMSDVIDRLLGFAKCDTFFFRMYNKAFSQAITFTRSRCDEALTEEQAKQVAYSLMSVHADPNAGKGVEHTHELYFQPFGGAHWALSPRGFGVTCNTPNFASQYMGRMETLYMPIIMLALHRKFAILHFTDRLGCTGRELERLGREMRTFRVRHSFNAVSDNPNVQRIYELILQVNNIDEMTDELDEKTESLIASEQSSHRIALEKITGVLTLAFSLMSITSILVDGAELIERYAPAALQHGLTVGLFCLLPVLVVAAVLGIIAVSRHTR